MNAMRPRNRNRETASAARNATTSVTTTVNRVTVRLIRSAERKSPFSKTRVKLSSVPGTGKNVGSVPRILLPGRKALLTIQ